MNQRDGLSMEERRAFWGEAVQLWRESGLTVAAFARREKLSSQTLNAWKVRFLGKGVPPRSSAGKPANLAVPSNSANFQHSAILPPERSGKASTQVREFFSPIHLVADSSVERPDSAPDHGLNITSAWQIMVCGSRRIVIGNAAVPTCLAEVIRVLERMEPPGSLGEDAC